MAVAQVIVLPVLYVAVAKAVLDLYGEQAVHFLR